MRAPEGFTLGELIDELRADPLIRADLATFENSLLAYGWLDTYRGQYAHDRYTLVRGVATPSATASPGSPPPRSRQGYPGCPISWISHPAGPTWWTRQRYDGRCAGRDHGERVRCGMHGDTVEDFLISLDQTVNDQPARSPGWLRRDAFVRVAADYLVEDGTLEDLEVCYYQAPSGRSKMEVAGYAISDDGRVLDLAVAGYGYMGQTVPQDLVHRQFRWALTFAGICRDGHHLKLEESCPPTTWPRRSTTDGRRSARYGSFFSLTAAPASAVFPKRGSATFPSSKTSGTLNGSAGWPPPAAWRKRSPSTFRPWAALCAAFRQPVWNRLSGRVHRAARPAARRNVRPVRREAPPAERPVIPSVEGESQQGHHRDRPRCPRPVPRLQQRHLRDSDRPCY